MALQPMRRIGDVTKSMGTNLGSSASRAKSQLAAMPASGLVAGFNRWLAKRLFGNTARAKIYDKFARFIDDGGLTETEAIASFQRRYETRNDVREVIFTEWRAALERGEKFHEAIADWVSPSEQVLIAAGEESGKLGKALRTTSFFLTAQGQMLSALISRLIMPAILLLGMIAIVVMFGLEFQPMLVQQLPLEQWPESGQKLAFMSRAIIEFWWLITPLLVGLVAGVAWLLPNWTGAVRDAVGKLPGVNLLFGTYASYQSAGFLIGLVSMHSAGITLSESLKRMRELASPWMAAHMDEMLDKLRRGIRDGEAMDTGMLPRDMADDVIDYSRSTSFGEALEAVGKTAIEDGVKKVTAAAAVANFLALMLVGGAIVSVYATTMQVTQSASKAAAARR